MFNVDLKSPELSMRAAAAGSSRKSQAPDLCGEDEAGGSRRGAGGWRRESGRAASRSAEHWGGDPLNRGAAQQRGARRASHLRAGSGFKQAFFSFSYAWGPPSAPHPQVKAGCTGRLFLSRETDLPPPSQTDPPHHLPPRILHEKLPASSVFPAAPGRADAPSPALSASPPSATCPPRPGTR